MLSSSTQIAGLLAVAALAVQGKPLQEAGSVTTVPSITLTSTPSGTVTTFDSSPVTIIPTATESGCITVTVTGIPATASGGETSSFPDESSEISLPSIPVGGPHTITDPDPTATVTTEFTLEPTFTTQLAARQGPPSSLTTDTSTLSPSPTTEATTIIITSSTSASFSQCTVTVTVPPTSTASTVTTPTSSSTSSAPATNTSNAASPGSEVQKWGTVVSGLFAAFGIFVL